MGCSSTKQADNAQDNKNKNANGKDAGGGENVDREKAKAQAKQDNRSYQQNMTFLSQVPLLKRLPRDQHPLLAAAVVPCQFNPGDVIIKQGDMGSEFFVIKSGEANVLVASGGGEAKKVATLKSGDYFGENALLRDEPRSATITAESKLDCLKIARAQFQELGLHEKLQFANRKAVAGGNKKQQEAKEPTPKNQQERSLIIEALRNNPNLQTMVSLDDSRAGQMADVAWKETVSQGKNIITEGDLAADYFYIVQDGCFEIFVTEQEEGNENGEASKPVTPMESKHVSTVKAGGSFGELALLYLVPRAATVKATEDSTVWVIDRMNFKNILMKVSDDKIKEYVKYLGRVELLSPLLAEEKKAVAQALVEMHFTKGETILQQGEPGNTFYILYEGECVVVKDGVENNKLQASQSSGIAKYFGERALLNNEPRAASVVVTSSTAKALALDRDSFTMLLGPLQDLIDNKREGGARTAGPGQAKMDEKRMRIRRQDLTRIGLLGCGGFGAVELWEHKSTKESYALKGISKGYIVKTGMQESVMNEKNILLMTNSPFIIKLFETYNGSQTLYFLLEPALGGEIYALYNRKGLHGSEKHAKFYVAGTVFAFEHCHERRIIYRDLKPENLLLNEKGHLKLTDMGLAKFVIGKTYTTCGTPDYFAPEIITSTGHTNAVDWWMLGILTFELMSGHPPFESAYPMQIYSKVMKGINKVPFPAKCQGSVEQFIKGLLQKDPSERLAMRPGGTKNLRDAKWYSGFDWTAMQNMTLDPPYKPVVQSKTDIANFNARKEDMPKHVEYKDDGSGWDKDFAS